MEKRTLDDFSIEELIKLPAGQILEIRRHTIEFILQTLDPSGILSRQNNNNHTI